MRSAAIVLLLLALALGAAACGSPSPETTAGGFTSTTLGVTTTAGSGRASAPDVSGVTLDGAKVSLSQYRGKPLVLAFMASW